VDFSAAGSYQYSQLATRQYVADADLQFKWDFGDGSPAAFGKAVKHTFKAAKDEPYKVTLTVTNRDSRKSDTATRNVLVETCDDKCANDADPDQSADPGLRAQNSVVACQSGTGFTSLSVKPAGKGLRVDATAPNGNSFLAELFQAAKGRKAGRPKKLTAFTGAGSATWNGKLKRGKLSKGTYFLRVSTRGTGPRPDVRGFGFDRKGTKFKSRKPFQRTDSCELLSLVRLDAPAFGGKRALLVNFTTTKAAKVTVSVFRGKARKALRKFTRTTSPNRLARVKVAPKKLKRGEYRIVVSAAGGGGKQAATLYAVKY
jgi:PKD repeat protein